jgi:hypothetical protein
LDALIGSLIAWIIAVGSILFFAGYSYRKKRQMRPSGIPVLDFVAAMVLTYIAIDISNPVPYLSAPVSSVLSSPMEPLKSIFEQTKFSYVVLLIALLIGLSVGFGPRHDEEKRGISERPKAIAWKNFAIMTLLPIIIQYWVLVASTDRLTTYGGILAVGLFVLAGPASWQFAMRIVLFEEKGRKMRIVRLFVFMLVSLVGVIIATFFGLYLGANQTSINQNVLSMSASFTLIAVPYFFFYSYWGDKWSENRAIAVIIGMVALALFSITNIANTVLKFVVAMLFWAFLLVLPFVLYSSESLRHSLSWPESGGEIRVFKDDRVWVNDETRPVTYRTDNVEEKKSFLRLLYFAFFERYRSHPWNDEMIVSLSPDKDCYEKGEKVTVNTTVRCSNKRKFYLGLKHSVHCKVFVRWVVNSHTHEIDSPEKWIDSGKEVSWSYETEIPPPPPTPIRKKCRLRLEVEAMFFEIQPKDYFIQSVTIPFKRRISVKRYCIEPKHKTT